MEKTKKHLINWLNTNTGLNIQSIYDIANDIDKRYKDELNEQLRLGLVSRSLINKESLILVLKDKIIKRKLLYGTMQTEQEVNTYVDGFIDCMKAINKY